MNRSDYAIALIRKLKQCAFRLPAMRGFDTEDRQFLNECEALIEKSERFFCECEETTERAYTCELHQPKEENE